MPTPVSPPHRRTSAVRPAKVRAVLARVCLWAMLPLLALLGTAASANEAVIRKNLAERLQNFPKIDEVTRTPMPGLFEVRVNGTELFYTDAEGSFLLDGNLIDTQRRRNLTEERMEKLLAIDFDNLPLRDAIVMVRGSGKRRMAVFADPNCGYCKRFERDLQTLDNVTVYLFLYPILGADSADKSRNVWCSRDRAKAWNDWMLRGQAPASANCDTAALARNVEFGRKNRISGTPTTFFENGQRVPGALPLPQIERALGDARN